MKRIRFNNLGIEIEIRADKADFFDVKEFKNCVRISHGGARIATVLKDSKVVISDIVHIICYKGRIVAFGNAYVEVGGMSRVFARDKTCVEACQGAEVRAGGRTKVRALDSSRVIAGGRAEVYLDGKSIGYKKPGGRVRMHRLDNRAAIFDLN